MVGRATRQIKVAAAWVFYRLVVQFLPNWAPGSRRLRPLVIHGFAEGVSTSSNINRRVLIGRGAVVCHNAGIGEGSVVPSGVTLGAHVTMGPGCVFITGDHPVPPDRGYFRDMRSTHRPIKVGDDVFLGRGAIILPGVSIGRGAAVGAGAVVARDVPAGATVVGNPARAVRTREVPPPSVFHRESLVIGGPWGAAGSRAADGGCGARFPVGFWPLLGVLPIPGSGLHRVPSPGEGDSSPAHQTVRRRDQHLQVVEVLSDAR